MHKYKNTFKNFAIPVLIVFLILFIVIEKIIMGIKSALDIVSNFLFYYHFIHSHSYLSKQPPASVAGVTYSQQQGKH